MKRINKARIILLLLFLATFIGNIIGNIRLKNQNKQFLNKSYSIPLETFLFNRATTDKNGNVYVANDMLSVVQKFNNNGQFIKSIWINDDIYIIKSEDDGIHVYAGKFDNVDYRISKNKIFEKQISEKEMDHVEADPRQNIIGNLWIHNGKITFLKASIFPIDSSIVICMYILMECFLFVKKKIYKETNNNTGK